MPPLDVEPHSSAHSSVAVPQVSSRDAGSWRQPVQRPGWSGRGEGSVGSRCVSCRKTSPSKGRGSAARCGAGREVPAPASLTVCQTFIPGKGIGFAWCHQRHKRLRKLGGTAHMLAVALSPLRGRAAGWLGRGGGDAGGLSLQAGFGEAPEQTWHGCRKPGPWGKTKCGPAALWSPRGL